MPAMEAVRTLALIDQDLAGPLGHNLSYAQRVLTAAEQRGLRVTAGVARGAGPLHLPGATYRAFTSDLRANNPAYARRWRTAAIVHRHTSAKPTRTGPAATEALAPESRRSERLAGVVAGMADDLDVVVGVGRRSRSFADQIAAFLDAAGLSPGDIVFMPTVLAGELLALEQLLRTHALARQLRWRLLLRYAPGERLVRRTISSVQRRLQQQGFADIAFYADTEALTRFYGDFCTMKPELLPIPVTPVPARQVSSPLVIGYFGDVRDEKGADLLPEIVERTLAQRADGLTFLIQANLNGAGGDAASRAARDRLKRMAGAGVELLDGPLSQSDYDHAFGRAHIVLLPYRPQAYAYRSSGVLMEALAAGLPTVVTTGSWMQGVLEQADSDYPAGRIANADPTSLADALLQTAANWTTLAKGARKLGRDLRWRWDPEQLVRRLAAD